MMPWLRNRFKILGQLASVLCWYFFRRNAKLRKRRCQRWRKSCLSLMSRSKEEGRRWKARWRTTTSSQFKDFRWLKSVCYKVVPSLRKKQKVAYTKNYGIRFSSLGLWFKGHHRCKNEDQQSGNTVPLILLRNVRKVVPVKYWWSGFARSMVVIKSSYNSIVVIVIAATSMPLAMCLTYLFWRVLSFAK